MADIRINSLPSTATSTASDDYVAIDGSANGTRKLSAYSPTFGGNLTVSGSATAASLAVTTNASTNAVTARYNSSNSLFGMTVNSAGQGVLAENADNATGTDKFSKTGLPAFRLGNVGGSNTYPFNLDVSASGTAGNAITWTNAIKVDGSTNATLAGNLTVSGGSCILGSSTSVLYFGTPSSNYQYFDGTDLFWRIGGLDRMVIKSGGNLGIGTTSPSDKLHVSGAGRFARSTDSSQYLNLTVETGNAVYNAAGSINHVFQNAGTEQMRLNSSGNLLLGTTTDSSNGKLQLATHTTSAGGIGFGADSSLFSASATVLRFNGQNADTQIQIAKNGTTGFGILVDGASTYITASGSSGVMYLRTNGGTTALTLDASQNATFAGAATAVGQVRGSNVVASDLGGANKGFFGTAGADAGSAHRLALVRTDTPTGGSALLSAFGAIAFEVGATTGLNTGTRAMTITSTGKVNMSSLPTSSSGLSAGDIWNDGGTLKIV